MPSAGNLDQANRDVATPDNRSHASFNQVLDIQARTDYAEVGSLLRGYREAGTRRDDGRTSKERKAVQNVLCDAVDEDLAASVASGTVG
ncbi:hypothetical protein GCM10007874_60190 [Labrys miyagiensis]|uniref:Uncharacterized protein n=1 Tax=Labrys miyagiensis TaxID=346912 RepID=A0ABQ6CTE2_9HYPH|nr:hypothetical protein GCM10007874_60190 [Labrys miyagiensis]